MKTYIWNTEYDVYVAHTETVEMAKMLIRRQWSKNIKAERTSSLDIAFPNGSAPLHLVKSWISGVIDLSNDLCSVMAREPDIVLDPDNAEVYSHANE